MAETNALEEFAAKMRSAGVIEPAIAAFAHNYSALLRRDSGMIPEASLEPVPELPRFNDIAGASESDVQLLSQAVVVKLNGGLGTSMGLERAKSLLVVKDGLTFLDLIARQILQYRQRFSVPLRFLLMNSFSTSSDTREFLQRYSELGGPEAWELLQTQVPKVDAKTFRPVSWAAKPQLEWCPPGHGDFYPSLLASGRLDNWLREGVKYLFISNADNFGAVLDPGLLRYFAESRKPFLMEVAERTAADRKGGHLAAQNGRLLLRESAQCPPADQGAFQDIHLHRYFNTNNLWVSLVALKALLERHGGFVPLPLIKNSKTVDPRDKNSPPVYQLETALGAAIGSFPDAGAILVPRGRFLPVKTTSDLLALRSDAYRLTDDWRIVLVNPSYARGPAIDLDNEYYRLVDQLDQALAAGLPSLKDCAELTVRGPVLFSNANVFLGKVAVSNPTTNPKPLSPGAYRDTSIELK